MTHNDAEGHDTALRTAMPWPGGRTPLRWVARQARRPSVGRRELKATPDWSTATQNVRDGHDTPASDAPSLSGSIVAAFHALLPPAGWVELSTRPRFASTATHKAFDAHEMATSSSWRLVVLQEPVRALG